MLLFRAKAHYVFDARAVIPAAIEDHDLTRRGKVLHVTLQIDLRFLAIRGRWEGDNAENPRTNALGNGLDRAALSRAIAALENDNNAQPLGPYPFLQLAEFDLKFVQFLFVFLTLEFRLPGVVCESFCMGVIGYLWGT